MIVLGSVFPVVGFGPVIGARVESEPPEPPRGADRLRQFVEGNHRTGIAHLDEPRHEARIAAPCRAGTIEAAR